MNKKIIISQSIMWGAAIFAVTNEPTWLAVGVAIGAALSWRKSKIKN